MHIKKMDVDFYMKNYHNLILILYRYLILYQRTIYKMLMLKFIKKFIFPIICILCINPMSADNNSIEKNIGFRFNSANTLGKLDKTAIQSKSSLITSLKSYTDINEANINLSLVNSNKILLDNTYFQKSYRNSVIGFGLIDRNWSFSPKSSLILSPNAPPFKSIYLKFDIDNIAKDRWFSSLGATSLEIINGFLEGNENPNGSMLFGMRATINPSEKFHIEAMRISQWGGYGYSNDPSVILKTLFGDTNNGQNSNINQIAGLGFSFIPAKTSLPIRIYAQVIGEDEAGNLPSCLMHLAGSEWQGYLFGQESNIGIEFVDTRVGHTKHGFCGPNTAYNNTQYKYSNDGIVMGVPIDTEGKSIELFGNFKINSLLNTSFSSKKVLLNARNWNSHRLSDKSQNGWLHSASVSWAKSNFTISGNLNYQGFSMEKVNSYKGIGVGINSNIKF